MTKKSMSRLQRDADEQKIKDARGEAAEQIKGNTIYDDIHGMYTECGRMLIGYAESYNHLNLAEAKPRFNPEQATRVDTLISGFNTDIRVLQSDLIKIRAPFMGMSGGEADIERFAETVGVVQQFEEFIGRSKGVMDPTFRSLAAEVASLPPAEQDPKVITDVEVKQKDATA